MLTLTLTLTLTPTLTLTLTLTLEKVLTLTLTLILTPTLTPLTKVRDYVLELSMNANVQQALNHDELHAIFSEADVLRDACMRGGRAAGASDELLSIVQAAVGQIS